MMRTGFFAAPQRSGVVGIKQILTRQVCFLPLLLHFCTAAAAAAVAGAGRFFLRQNEVFTTYMPACYLSGFVAASSCMQVQLRRGRFLLMMIVITKPVE
jgi:hypothetical protein